MSWLVGAVKSLGEGQARQFVSCPQPFRLPWTASSAACLVDTIKASAPLG
jgi:hypothetical protein